MRAITQRGKALVGVLAIAAIASACAPKVAQGPATCSKPVHPTATVIFNRVNAARAASGLGALSWNPQLHCLAVEWSQYMASTGTLRHRDLNATIQSSAYSSYRTLGENILRGGMGMTGDQMHDAWMASAPHRANILSSSYNSIGIGFGISPDGGTVYATENFGG